MPNVCQRPYLEEGKLLRCGGEFREVVERENGQDVLYEVCSRVACGNKRTLIQIIIMESQKDTSHPNLPSSRLIKEKSTCL